MGTLVHMVPAYGLDRNISRIADTQGEALRKNGLQTFASAFIFIILAASTLNGAGRTGAASGKNIAGGGESGKAGPKAGYSFVPLPMLAYDAAKGILFGAMMNIYNFGDGSSYPDPRCSWYLEASGYTGGSQTYVASFDSGKLLPHVRFNAAGSYFRDKAMEFFGFNGYQTRYDTSIEDGFYMYGRGGANFKADFTGPICRGLYWDAGYHFNYFTVNEYSSSKYSGEETLFGLYRKWGILGDDMSGEKFSSAIRAGITYDSRDHEGVPGRGLLAGFHLITAPKFLGSSDSYVKFNASFIQYVPIIYSKLTFAYHIDYQDFIGKAPWYVLPFYSPGGPKYDNVHLGGTRIIRGMKYNRTTGTGVGYFNAELRWNLWNFNLWKQDIGVMLSGFCDGIRVFRGYDLTNVTGYAPDLYSTFTDTGTHDRFHISGGGALKIILNRNFVLNIECARCASRKDGTWAFYLNSGFYF